MFWEGLLLQILKATKQSQNNKERLQSVSNSETDVTVNLTTFIELLATMMVTQKINKSGWMDPSDDWDKLEAKTRLECSKHGKIQVEWVTGASRRESYLSFSVLSPLKKTVSQGQGNLWQ